MRKCYVHIGRHKTGSSAIQWALHHHRDELKRRGYLYPETGIPPTSVTHYNIAWELTKLSHYEPRYGTIDGLIAEINEWPHHVVLSCEDFTIALQSFAEFQAFVERLKDCGLTVIVVCYVRSPHAYLRSAFLELLKSGFPFGFSRFITAILDDEAMRWKDQTAGDRDRVVENLIRLAESGDADVVVRSYDEVSQTVVADFFAVIGLTFSEFSSKDEPRRNEANATEQALALFFQNVTGRAPDSQEHALIAGIGAVAPMSDLHMSEPAWRLTARKYEPELQALASRFGVRLPNPAGNPGRMADRPTLEEVFCDTAIRSIQTAARSLADAVAGRDHAYKELVAHYLAAIADRDARAAEHEVLVRARNEAVAQRDHAYKELEAHYLAAIGARDSLAAECDRLTRARDALIAERDTVAVERDGLKATQADVAAAFDAVLKSRSWRLTEPFRNVNAWLASRTGYRR
jgi:hypothetical protein